MVQFRDWVSGCALSTALVACSAEHAAAGSGQGGTGEQMGGGKQGTVDHGGAVQGHGGVNDQGGSVETAGTDSKGGEGGTAAAAGGTRAGGGSTASGDAGQAGHEGGTSGAPNEPACQPTSVCVASSCASRGCFDLDRCAARHVSFWGTAGHDNAEGLVLTANDERVIVGYTQLGNESNSDRDLFVTRLSVSGQEVWSLKLGTPAPEFGTGITIDADGFIYATGSSQGDLDGHQNAGGRDVFVIKVSPAGELLWSVLFGTENTDQGEDIAVGADGSVLVVGSWNYTPNNTQRPFLARISAAGELIEAVPLAAIDHGSAATLEVDKEGNAYVTGEKLPPDSGVGDAFAKKIAPDDTELWSVEWGSTKDDWTNGTALSDDGRLYVVGTTAGAIGPNPAPNIGDWSVFLSVIDASGNVGGTRTYFPGVDTRGGAVTLGKNGDVLLAGGVLGKLAPDDEAYGMDILALRLCADGGLKATQRRDLGSDEWSWGIREAKDGSVLLSGYSFQRVTGGAAQDSVSSYVFTVQPE